MSRRVASEKRRYVRDSKEPEIDWPTAEMLGEEPVDMPRVVGDRCTIQPSFFLQKDTVFVRQTLCWIICDRSPLRRDHAYITQEREQQP